MRHIQDAELLYSPKRDLRRQACRKSEIQYPLCFKFNHLGEALMADIFLSYSQKDAERASRVAATLKRAGWDVWWDANLFAGSSFRREITEQLKSAKCVVVLWSRNANDSTFVPDEAEDGKRRGILVQAILDDVEPPLGFRGIQWADLTSWSGGTEHRGLADLLNGIARHVQRPSIRPQPKQAPVSPAPPKPRSKPLAEQREPIAEAVHPNVISHEVSSASPITKSKGVVTLSPHEMSSIRRSY